MNKKRERAENWTGVEREIFINIMRDSVRIIECKNADTDTNKRKQAEWLKVQEKFQRVTGKLRDVKQMKGFWRRIRLVAKQNMVQCKKALHATGEGEKLPSLTQEEQHLIEMCPAEFIIEENEFDSDGSFQKDELKHRKNGDYHSEHNVAPQQQENCECIIDIEDEAKQGETTLNKEIDEDTNNPEVPTKNDYLTPAIDRSCEKDKIATSLKFNKYDFNHRANQVGRNIEMKEKAFHLMKEEHDLKRRYHQQELSHQEMRHKLEIDILLLKKEKIQLKLDLLKSQLGRK